MLHFASSVFVHLGIWIWEPQSITGLCPVFLFVLSLHYIEVDWGCAFAKPTASVIFVPTRGCQIWSYALLKSLMLVCL